MSTAVRYRFLATAALADGHLDEREKPILLKAATEWGLSRDEANEVIEGVRKGGAQSVSLPADPGKKAEVFRFLVDLAAADGEIEAHELKLFQRIAPHFDLDEMQVEQILRSAEEVARSKKK